MQAPVKQALDTATLILQASPTCPSSSAPTPHAASSPCTHRKVAAREQDVADHDRARTSQPQPAVAPELLLSGREPRRLGRLALALRQGGVPRRGMQARMSAWGSGHTAWVGCGVQQ